MRDTLSIFGANYVAGISYADMVKTVAVPAAKAYAKVEAAALKQPRVTYGNDDPLKNHITYLSRLHDAYVSHGLSDNLVSWNLIQDSMESGGFSNAGAKQNNPGNIMWPKGGLSHGKRGTYNTINKTYYADFNNLNDYVIEKIKVLNKAPGRPIDATSVEDYVHRLKMNNYFGKESEASYLAAMRGTAKNINLVAKLQDDSTGADLDKNLIDNDKDKPNYLLWGGIALGTLVIVRLIR